MEFMWHSGGTKKSQIDIEWDLGFKLQSKIWQEILSDTKIK